MTRHKYSIGTVIAMTNMLLIATVWPSMAQFEKTENKIPNHYHNTLASPFIPPSMTFAGEKVPLSTYWVREALDKELIINCYQHSRTLRIFKLSTRFFPVIENILREEGIPDDFKYLCVAESGLENVTSPASAVGYWQFIPNTAKIYGLTVNREIDERRHLEKSTRAACTYLKKLKAQFGSWTMAAAAYNRGEIGLQNAVSDQKCSNYWDLYLNDETARYVYRILAYKLVFENPRIYGLEVCPAELYYPVPCKEEQVSATIDDLPEYASKHRVTYKEFRMLNPWIRGYKLTVPAGTTYTLKIPIKAGGNYRDLYNHIDNPYLILGDSVFHGQ